MFALNDKGLKLTTRNYIFLLFFLTTFLISPLIDNKIILGHDHVFHVTRILDVSEALKEGIFPVRIYVDEIQFWGTPVGIFYPGLFVYIPALLKLAGLPIEICYNFFNAMIVYTGAISSWFGFSMLTRSKIAGFFSAILYVSSNWYLMDAYVRSALGELLGLSFLPLAMACIIDFITKQKVPIIYYVLGILAISAIIESHVLSTAFLFLFSLFYIVKQYKHITLKIIKRIVYLTLIILLLNATFIVPFLYYYIKVPITLDYVNLFSKLGWPMPVLLGFAIFANMWLFIAVPYFLLARFNIQKVTTLYKNNIFVLKQFLHYSSFFLAGILFLLLSSNVVSWNSIIPFKKVFEIMQFPWRFLGVATLFFCICNGAVIRFLVMKEKLQFRSVTLLALVICIINMMVFIQFGSLPFQGIQQKDYWVRIQSSTDNDYLYKGMDANKLFEQSNSYVSDALIYNWEKKLNTIFFSYSAQEDTTVTLPLVNYPGYKAEDQKGSEVQIKENDNHMILLNLPKGEGSIKVYYQGLLLFKIADDISVVALFILLFYIARIQKRRAWYELV